MKLHEEESPAPALSDFPSAKAHGGGVLTKTSGRVRKRKRSFLALVARVLTILVVLGAIAFGGAFWFIGNGPINSEQFRAQAESRLTALLGFGRSVKLGGAILSFGQGGIVSINASDIRILQDETINLGVAKEVALTVKALPFLSGNVVVDKMNVRGASVSLPHMLGGFAEPKSAATESADTVALEQALSELDLTQRLTAVGTMLLAFDAQFASAGLDRFDLQDAKLLGFEDVGLLSRSARLISLNVERDRNFQSGIFMNGVVETDRSQWSVDAAWRHLDGEEGYRLEARFGGLDVQEFLGDQATADVKSGSTLELRIVQPFDANGAPKDGLMTATLSGGKLEVGADLQTAMADTVLNFQVFPAKNQIELAPSMLRFSDMQASAIGGIRFPGKPSDTQADRVAATKLEIILNDMLAHGMSEPDKARPGALQLSGELHADRLEFDTLLLKTSTGDMKGSGQMGLSADDGRLKLRLDIAEMGVTDFKEFWPAFLAPGLRVWARDGITDGKITDAWVVADAPLTEVFGEARFSNDEMRANVDLSGTRIKLPGQLPSITNTKGKIDYAGVTTSVSVSSGKANLGSRGSVAITNGLLEVGDYNLPVIPAELSMDMSGPATALFELGMRKPLEFSKTSGLEARGMKGTFKTSMKASLGIGKDVTLRDNRWAADVALRNFNARIDGGSRSLTNGRLSVKARPGKTMINGKANVDGVPADLAMVQSGASGQMQRSASLLLDEKARAKMGINLAPIVNGPISVLVNAGDGNNSELTVDLKTARLDFPWIGWSKGKGIPATATMTIDQKGNRISISNFRLRGKGFQANGKLVVAENALQSASFRDVKLNRTDDIDVDVKRSSSGFEVNFNGRSYDARSMILGLGKAARGEGGSDGNPRVIVKGKMDRLIGFGGQILSGVSVNMTQKGGRIASAYVSAVASGNAPTSFEMKPLPGGMQTLMQTTNAGALLSFLDIYSNVRGGRLTASFVRDSSQVFRGKLNAVDFDLLNEPRLGVLLRKPPPNPTFEDGERIYDQIPKLDPNKVRVDRAEADIEKGPNFLRINRGRISGGDASAAFKGTVFDRRNRIDISGTFLPARNLNRFVSRIPLLGLAFGKGKVNGLLGITFRLSGPYGNPRIRVNPLSLIAPGVFRKLFEF
ncbi:MAG: DUF3971 domain-containing protein [Pseudomonadota bacterium]